MTWEDEVDIVKAFDSLMKDSIGSLHKWMDLMHERGHLGNTPPELLIRVVANFVHNYNENRKVMDAPESITMTKAMAMDDPILHYLVQMNVGNAVSDGVSG